MRTHVVMSVGVAVLSAVGTSAAPPNVSHSNGDAGQFYFSSVDVNTGTGYSAFALFNESGPGPEAGVCYTVYELVNWNAQITENGCGSIPSTDVQGSAHGTLSIDTDTSGPSFTRFAGNGGVIKVTLRRRQAVPGYEVEEWSSGQSRRDYGYVVVKSSGSQFSAPAQATGVILSLELPESTSAQLYTSRQMTIEVQPKTP